MLTERQELRCWH